MSFGFKAAIVQQHAFSERLNDNIGDDRDLVNALIHKYDPVPMSGLPPADRWEGGGANKRKVTEEVTEEE